MRAVAIMRERYGFTADESLDMSQAEFEEWLEALREDQEGERVKYESSGECTDPGRIGREFSEFLYGGGSEASGAE